jgi:hypothetical protein
LTKSTIFWIDASAVSGDEILVKILTASSAVIVGIAGGSVVQNWVMSYVCDPRKAASGAAHLVGILLSNAPAVLLVI